MSVTEFKRGVPTYKDKNDNEFGLLCETKEVCVTDNDGVSLEYKLQTLMQNVTNLTSELQSCAKASDLSNYLQKSGGTINGNVMVSKNGAGLVSVEDTANGRQIGLLTSGGKCGLYDYTNSKWIVENTASGTNTFNGTATGNLPLTGGTVASNTGTPFEISNTTEGANVAFTKYSAGGKELGRMGYQGEGVPTIRVPNGKYYQLLHTGNSEKVVVSQTAPSDTSALWVW